MPGPRRVAPRVPKCPPGCPEAVPSSRAADVESFPFFWYETGVNSAHSVWPARARADAASSPRRGRGARGRLDPSHPRPAPPDHSGPRQAPYADVMASEATSDRRPRVERTHDSVDRDRAAASGSRRRRSGRRFSDEQKRRMQLVYLLHLRDLHRWRQIRRPETRLRQGRYPRVGCRGSSIINGIRVQSARPSERGPGSGGGVERETEADRVFFRSESETRPTDE